MRKFWPVLLTTRATSRTWSKLKAEHRAGQGHGERAGADRHGGAAGRDDGVQPAGAAQAVELAGGRAEVDAQDRLAAAQPGDGLLQREGAGRGAG